MDGPIGCRRAKALRNNPLGGFARPGRVAAGRHAAESAGGQAQFLPIGMHSWAAAPLDGRGVLRYMSGMRDDGIRSGRAAATGGATASPAGDTDLLMTGRDPGDVRVVVAM